VRSTFRRAPVDAVGGTTLRRSATLARAIALVVLCRFLCLSYLMSGSLSVTAS
jgi:hypothetical protein